MNIIMEWVVLGIGVALALSFRQLSGYFDTAIHEIGHGIAGIPFGVPVPGITIQPNTEGETRSSNGIMSQFFPKPLARMLELFARFLTLISGYSASILLGGTLIMLAFTREHYISPWFLAMVSLMLVGTLLWTLVRLMDNSALFFVLLALVAGISLYLGFGWWTVLIMGVLLLALVVSKELVGILAILSSSIGFSLIIPMVFQIEFPENELWSGIPTTYDSLTIARTLLIILAVFAILSCRSLFSLLVMVVSFAIVMGLVYQEWWSPYYSILGLSGLLVTSGFLSFVELYRITFKDRRRPAIVTDMVLAVQDLGGSARGWFVFTITCTIVMSGVILWWGLGS